MAPPDVEISSDAELKIAGWGLENEKNDALSASLMEATVFFVNNDECNKILGYGRVSDSMICAGDLINGRDGTLSMMTKHCSYSVRTVPEQSSG